jgi:hypothetical protein
MNKSELSKHTQNALIVTSGLKPQIEVICRKGFLSKPYNAPREIFDAYNRIIFELGNIVGWKDKSKNIIDFDKLIPKFESSLNFYLIARQGLIENIEESVVDCLSDVLILESSFKKDPLSEAFGYEVCSVITIIRLIKFHQDLGDFLLEDEVEINENVYEAFLRAQSHLLAAQDLLLKAIILLSSSNARAMKSIDKTGMELFYKQEILRHKQSVAGKKSNYDKIYEWVEQKAKEYWLIEKSNKIKITRIGAMASKLLSEYKVAFPYDKNARQLNERNIGNIRSRIKPISDKIAPEASAKGRPPKSP